MDNVTATVSRSNFLQGLRKKVHLVNGVPQAKSTPLSTGQGAIEVRELELLLDFDLAIVGGSINTDHAAPTTEKPLGALGTGGTESLPGTSTSWLHHVVTDHKPKAILMIPGKGGQYPKDQQDLIRKAFGPHLTWHFPELPNLPGIFFYDPAATVAFVQALIKQEILR